MGTDAPGLGTVTVVATSPGDPPPAGGRALAMVARRGCQHLIDLALSIGAGVMTGLAVGLVVVPLLRWGWVVPETLLWGPLIAFFAVTLAVELLIHVWVPLRRGGVTPGMVVVGLRITSLRGGEPGVRDYLVRWFLLTVDGLLLGLVAAVSIMITPRRQRIGDVLARTVVVRVS